MRSIALRAAVGGMLVLASACSDDGGSTTPPDNATPNASFAIPSCVAAAPCTFSSTSTDDVAVIEWFWDFDNDGDADAVTETAAYTFAQPGNYPVKLTVRDAGGLSDDVTSTVTVTASNGVPVANFALPTCVINVACNFSSSSTDDVAVTGWSWDFNGDGTADATTADAAYTYTAAGDYNVSLTVVDADGRSNTKTQTITIAPPAVNTPPTASFTAACNGTTCTFISTSSDAAPGTITTYAWNFGDAGTSDQPNPQHVYVVTAPRSFDVSLTVTDNEGATAVATQSVSVSPAPAGAEGCVAKTVGRNPTRNIVDCAFNVPVKSNMKVPILGLACENIPGGQRVVAPPPIGDQMFLDICTLPVGSAIGIFGGPLDELIVYEAGSQVVIRFFQGFADGHDAIWPNPPSATFEGTYPDWIMHFEDGSQAGQPGEPDFADVVIGLHATPK
ncbi:MAG: PKD domain-containing protein [Gemmatimonadales bacterium]